MRMLAWINLLQTNGLLNKALSFGGVFNVHYAWLQGHSITVVLGLVYGYIPYMILPLYAGLDRMPAATLEAARDLGANRFETFRRVTWRLSKPAVLVSLLVTTLPMLGDYFTADLLSGSPSTSMLGNLMDSAALTPGQTGQAGAFVLIILVISVIPMFLYVRSTRHGADVMS
jgi:ABC-type spermidine/putrescine transport system permease subunit I